MSVCNGRIHQNAIDSLRVEGCGPHLGGLNIIDMSACDLQRHHGMVIDTAAAAKRSTSERAMVLEELVPADVISAAVGAAVRAVAMSAPPVAAIGLQMSQPSD